MDAERELIDDVVDKVDGGFLRVLRDCLPSPEPRGVVDGGVLKPVYLFAFFPFENEELDVYLGVMARHFFSNAGSSVLTVYDTSPAVCSCRCDYVSDRHCGWIFGCRDSGVDTMRCGLTRIDMYGAGGFSL